MPFKVVYYFEDTSDPQTCAGNVCQTMQGWYDERPSRPHGGNCDCSIGPYFGYAEYTYKHFTETGGGSVSRVAKTWTTYPNPHPTEYLDASISISLEVKRSVKVSVSEIMTHFGVEGAVEETMTITREYPVRVPPKHEAKVEARIQGITTHFWAEKWATFRNFYDSIGGPDAPDFGEVFVGNEEGGILYEENSDVQFMVEFEPL